MAKASTAAAAKPKRSTKAPSGKKTSARPVSPRKAVPKQAAVPQAPRAVTNTVAAKKGAEQANRGVMVAAGKSPAAGKRAAPPVAALKPAAMKAVTTKLAATKVAATKVAATKVAATSPARATAGARLVAAAKAVPVTKADPPAHRTKAAEPAPAPRRPRAPVGVKRAAAKPPAAPAKPAHSFTVSHLNDADFKADGLRSYAAYRDLGIAAATAGLCQAHVIRFIPPTTDDVRVRHTHSVDLQLVYVLKGWIKNEFEGVGEQMMSTGSCWIQPSGIRHTVLEYSPDCEVLEIVVPADFATEEVA